MPRAGRRLWTSAACYHVFNRGHACETICHEDADRAEFLQLLRRRCCDPVSGPGHGA
jgi:hypothetical protein